MNKKDQPYFIGAGIAVVAWLILYSVFVAGDWTKRDEYVKNSNDTIKRIAEKQKVRDESKVDPKAKDEPKVKEDLKPLAVSVAVLDAEKQRQDVLMSQLKKIEFAQKLPAHQIQDVKAGEDPKNYFDKKRREALEAAQGKGLKFGAGWDDLGFRASLNDDPTPLNLARLYILNQFLDIASGVHIGPIVSIHYPKPFLIPLPDDPNIEKAQVVQVVTGRRRGAAPDKDKEKEESVEAAPPPQLGQIPLVVRLKMEERKFTVLLQELQKPSTENHGFFSIRGFSAMLKDSNTGMVEVEIALGAVFSEVNLKEWKIEMAEKNSGLLPGRPSYNVP